MRTKDGLTAVFGASDFLEIYMNKKVLKTMIALVVIFLVALYVLKIFFPQEFVMAIENKVFVAVGTFIDSHKWASIIMGVLIGIVFDYLYFGAVCQTMRLKLPLIIAIFVYNIAYSCFFYLAPVNIVSQSTNIVICIADLYMILLPVIYTKKLLPLAVTFSVNSVAQNLSLNIRRLGLLMTSVNSITILFMSLECYLWVFLLFLLFNCKKENKENGIL